MKRKRNVKLFIIAAFVIILSILGTTPFSLDNTPKAVQAAAPKIEYLGNVSYSRYMVGKFKVDGKYAFCLDHYKTSPPCFFCKVMLANVIQSNVVQVFCIVTHFS